MAGGGCVWLKLPTNGAQGGLVVSSCPNPYLPQPPPPSSLHPGALFARQHPKCGVLWSK